MRVGEGGAWPLNEMPLLGQNQQNFLYFPHDPRNQKTCLARIADPRLDRTSTSASPLPLPSNRQLIKSCVARQSQPRVWARHNSPVSKRKKQKELGKSGKRREDLHTGSVFRAEQDWMGYMSDFLVYPVKKRVFSPKKHFEVALTPN